MRKVIVAIANINCCATVQKSHFKRLVIVTRLSKLLMFDRPCVTSYYSSGF